MRIMVVGSKDWRASNRIYRALEHAVEGQEGPHTLITGAASGAEAYALSVAADHCWDVEKVKVSGDDYHARNKLMIESGVDLCLAFLRPDSEWAKDAAMQAAKAEIPLWKYVETPRPEERSFRDWPTATVTYSFVIDDDDDEEEEPW